MQDNFPIISIILPTYNGAKYIRRSIDSCLQQTYKNIELIIVDDGSTDETPRIIESYKDNRIRYLRHEKNRGLPNALNTGFAEASGDYLTWTSDDNYYTIEAIETMLEALKSQHCHFVYADFFRFSDEDSSKLILVQLPDVPTLEIKNNIGACFLYSRDVMQIIGKYDTDAFLAEDYDYWIRVSREFPMFHLSHALMMYREHKNSLSLSRKYEVEMVSILVRIKNNVLDGESNIEQATRRFRDIIAEKIRDIIAEKSSSLYVNRAGTPTMCLIWLIVKKNRILNIIRKFIARIRFTKKARGIIKAYADSRISLQDARANLLDIIDRV